MTRSRVTAVGALLSLAVAAAVFAQTQTQAGSFFQITTVTVKASGALDYEEYLKKAAAAREKAAIQTPSRVSVYSVRMGGTGFTYQIVSPFDKWADVDSWMPPQEIMTKAYGELEATKLLKLGRSAVESQRSEVFRSQPQLSTNPNAMTPPFPFASIARVEINPAMGAGVRDGPGENQDGGRKGGQLPARDPLYRRAWHDADLHDGHAVSQVRRAGHGRESARGARKGIRRSRSPLGKGYPHEGVPASRELRDRLSP